MTELALLLIGLGVMAWGTKLAVDHAIVIAHQYGLSDFFIGVAILAVGSDLPELVVSINAAIRNLAGQETSDLIIGNALGSCFGQFGLVMGIAGIVGYLTMPRAYVFRHGAVLLGGMLYLFLAGLDGTISRLEGSVLVIAFLIYIYSLFGEEGAVAKMRKNGHHVGHLTWVLLAAGLLMVIASSEVIVRSAVALAEIWGVKQSFVAIAIIGVGTSLPELSISIAALMRARASMSVGNLVGSNVLDVLLPMGLAAMIHPLSFASSLLWFDLPALFVLSALVLVFFIRRRGLQHYEAAALLLFYAVYILLKLLEA